MLGGPETPPPTGPTFKAAAPKAVWSPGQKEADLSEMTERSELASTNKEDKENLSPVWQPFGPLDDKPTFRSVKLDHLQFKSLQTNTSNSSTDSSSSVITVHSPENQDNQEPKTSISTATIQLQQPRKKHSATSQPSIQNIPNGCPGSPTSYPGSQIGPSGLPLPQNPTITLLQKAREGQFPKGASYIENVPYIKETGSKESFRIGEIPSVDGYEDYVVYAMPVKEDGVKTVTTIKAPEKYEGIGPTERGIPISLRTGVKDEYASDWYKTMFKSLHKFDKNRPNDDLQTIRYTRKNRTPHSGGYMSEPEYEKDEDFYKSRNVARGHRYPGDNKYPKFSVSNQHHDPGWYNYYFDTYHNQPKSIAEYEPGHSSIAEREKYRSLTRRYLPTLDQPKPKYIDGYESDSTLIRKTGSKLQIVDPELQKAQYRQVQKGGDIPFEGLGKPAPERPKFPQIGPASPLPYYSEADFMLDLDYAVNPHRYQESEVNIHYKTPVRNLEKEFIDEEELGQRQEEAMKRFYEEERYKKQMQQLQELEMRRHNDNLLPSQKSPIPLNRYDNPFEPDPSMKQPSDLGVAKVLYNFNAQSSRELQLKKNDIVKVLRKVDKNWYEGELDGLTGIFPISYVQLIVKSTTSLSTTPDSLKSPKDILKQSSSDGHAKAKFNFKGQTPVELSLTKGEMVILKRRVDDNWFEGQTTSGKGIFPASYVQILSLPKEDKNYAKKNPKLKSHRYGNSDPNKEAFSSYPNTSQSTQSSREESHSLSSIEERRQPLNQSLHIDTCNDVEPYRVLYSYKPQNDDELELIEGDTVYVMEKCDDGWFVGHRAAPDGMFGTFPGNYVEKKIN